MEEKGKFLNKKSLIGLTPIGALALLLVSLTIAMPIKNQENEISFEANPQIKTVSYVSNEPKYSNLSYTFKTQTKQAETSQTNEAPTQENLEFYVNSHGNEALTLKSMLFSCESAFIFFKNEIDEHNQLCEQVRNNGSYDKMSDNEKKSYQTIQVDWTDITLENIVGIILTENSELKINNQNTISLGNSQYTFYGLGCVGEMALDDVNEKVIDKLGWEKLANSASELAEKDKVLENYYAIIGSLIVNQQYLENVVSKESAQFQNFYNQNQASILFDAYNCGFNAITKEIEAKTYSAHPYSQKVLAIGDYFKNTYLPALNSDSSPSASSVFSEIASIQNAINKSNSK